MAAKKKLVRREWATTTADLTEDEDQGSDTRTHWVTVPRKNEPDPAPPGGPGWYLVSSVANRDVVYWFWEREA